jgi:hypothetical protein
VYAFDAADVPLGDYLVRLEDLQWERDVAVDAKGRLDLRLPEPATVRVHVNVASGEFPAEDSEVTFRRFAGGSVLTARYLGAGVHALHAAPGPLFVHARARGLAERAETFAVPEQESAIELHIALKPAAALRVTVLRNGYRFEGDARIYLREEHKYRPLRICDAHFVDGITIFPDIPEGEFQVEMAEWVGRHTTSNTGKVQAGEVADVLVDARD